MPARIDTRTALNRLLSNMHLLDAPIVDRHGIPYRTVEHAYQAAKTSNLEQRRALAALLNSDPQWAGLPAKSAGRRVTMDPGFNDKRLAIMEYLLRKKFSQPRFRDALLSTAPHDIVEIDPRGYDKFWGMTPTGQGLNHLGRIIQLIRSDLR
jgi:ribA/ribD-fused uncharacterized protein